MYLETSHDHLYVLCAALIAFMSGFSGLTLSKITVAREGLLNNHTIILSSFILGAGIWATHFVAMLGLSMKVEYFYDSLIILISALIAILMMGIALLLLGRFKKVHLAGLIFGSGILVMHFVAMSGFRLVSPAYDTFGIAISIAISLLCSTYAFKLAFKEDQPSFKNVALASLIWCGSVSLTHFCAMLATKFSVVDEENIAERLISHSNLIFMLITLAFLITGAFLIACVTYIELPLEDNANDQASDVVDEKHLITDTASNDTTSKMDTEEADGSTNNDLPLALKQQEGIRLPFQKDKKIGFVEARDICLVQADGHYSILHCKNGSLFSQSSISEIEKKLTAASFFRCHRSYLVNIDYVTGFERQKDTGLIHLSNEQQSFQITVSRTKVKQAKAILGL